MEFLMNTLFILMLFGIIFADHLGIEKYKSAMFYGVLAWFIFFIAKEHFPQIEHEFDKEMSEIMRLWLFLLSAMTFIAYLETRGWFEKMVLRFLPNTISEKKLLFVIGFLTFIFSGLADNMTTTLVALTVVNKLLKNHDKSVKNMYAVYVVFIANVGGLPLITGDVTTLMIFTAKVISMQALALLYIPAFATFIFLYLCMAPRLKGVITLDKSDIKIKPIDHKIAIIFFLTIAAIPLSHVMWDMPPVLVFLLGLSAMFVLISHESWRTKKEMDVLDYIRRIELDVLFFFLGVLLMVGALKIVGTLQLLPKIYQYMPEVYATFMIGIISAWVDNIPVTSALLKSNLPLDEHGWMLMTYAVGAGGSLVSFGSVAGIVAMGKVKTLNFFTYLRYVPILFVAYLLGYAITYGMTLYLS